MGLTVYYAPMSSATRVLWALEELGVAYEKIKVNLEAGDQRKPEYLALNPNGQVPLLVVDGTPIFESVAILAYLGETYGVDAGLFPPPSIRRGVAHQWMVWAAVALGDPVVRWYRAVGPRVAPENRDPAAGERAVKEVVAKIQILEAELAKRQYLLGDVFSLADIPAVTVIGWTGRLGLDLEPFPNVRAWTQRCHSRPAIARALAM